MTRIIKVAILLMLLIAVQVAFGEEDFWSSLPDTPGVVSREELITAMDVIKDTDIDSSLIYDYSGIRRGDALDLHIVFEDGVYGGGTNGYSADWLFDSGIVSDIDYDLDGDGVDELLLIFCGEDELRIGYPHTQGYVVIYEPVDGGYVRSAVIPINIATDGTSWRGLKLIERDGCCQIVFIRNDDWDGGSDAIKVEVYEYDGQGVVLTLIACAGVNCQSFAAIGPFDMAWRDRLDEGDLFYGHIDMDNVSGLHEGENYFSYDYTSVFGGSIEENGIEYWNWEALSGFSSVAEIVKEYGVELSYEIKIHRGYKEHYIYEGDDGLTLLWLKEGFELNEDYDEEYNYGPQEYAYIDVSLYSRLNHGE